MESKTPQFESCSLNGKSSHFGQLISAIVFGAIALLTIGAYATSRYGWPIYLELLSHFQVQYFVLSLVLLGILLFLRCRPFVYGGLFLCVMLAVPVLSWYPSPLQWVSVSDAAPQMRLLVANVNTKNREYEKVLDLVRAEQPDVAIFVEVDDEWKAQLDSLSDRFPYSSDQDHSYNRGILIYSLSSLNNTEARFFGSDENASVITQLNIAEQPVTLFATHPLPPFRLSYFHSRNRQMSEISQYLAEVKSPMILAGDLNATMWSPYYRQWINLTRLHNARDGFGILPTWPAPSTYQPFPSWLTWLFCIPIDHFLVSRDIEVIDIHTGANTGSDHKPLIVDLRVMS